MARRFHDIGGFLGVWTAVVLIIVLVLVVARIGACGENLPKPGLVCRVCVGNAL